MAVDQAKLLEKLDKGHDLNEDEVRYLQDRDQLPDEYERVPVTFNGLGGHVISNDPVAVLQNIDESRHAAIESEVERRVQEELAKRVGQELQHEEIVARTPHTGDANTAHRSLAPPAEVDDEDEDDEEGEEDYGDGWNNDSRRAELAKRGLSVDGNKDELIARLIEDDESKEE